jgi:hypothetical protein
MKMLFVLSTVYETRLTPPFVVVINPRPRLVVSGVYVPVKFPVLFAIA